MKSIILCHDANSAGQDGAELIVYWAGFSADRHAYSLPDLVEQREGQLKRDYLRWLVAIGQSEIDGKSLVRHLQLRDDFSFWWTTLLIEKSQWKSPVIYAVFRLMALERLHKEIGFERILFALDEPEVAKVMRQWCSAASIDFEVVAGTSRSAGIGVSGLFRRLPYSVKGFIGLLYFILLRYPLSRVSPASDGANRGQAAIGFVSYLFNLNRNKAEQGEFYSAYWTGLHDLTGRNRINNHWLHLYIKSALLPNAFKAAKLLDRFNCNGDTGQSHQTLESCLNLKTVMAAIRDYLFLLKTGRRLRRVAPLFCIPDSRLNIWPLLKRDWKDSVVGKTAMQNCLYLNLFEACMRAGPRLEKGFYLMESQGWERCLIYAWKKYQRGELIGVTHATIKEWDLRHAYIYDLCSGDFVTLLPIPDKIAVNGEAAAETLKKHGLPVQRLVPVEALRYLYLHGCKGQTGAGQMQQQKPGRRLLVLGDSQKRVTDSLLGLLSEIAADLPEELEIECKSHPLCPVQLSAWPGLCMKAVTSSLETWVDRYDIALTSNPSSAAVDAYLTGKKVISLRDPKGFNMSPLRGFAGVDFVSSAEELLEAIRAPKPAVSGIAQDYFYTEPDLHRWSSLLGCRPLQFEHE